MITVISGTNRPESRTIAVARHVVEDLRSRTDEAVELIDLMEVDHSFFVPGMYSGEGASAIRRLQEKSVLAANKFVFVAPEYNGSIPGALKTFIDALSVHRYKENFLSKPVVLIGTSTGRAGNLRGMDHLAQILLHMGAQLHLDKLPISKVDTLLDDAGKMIDQDTIAAIAKQTEYLTRI